MRIALLLIFLAGGIAQSQQSSVFDLLIDTANTLTELVWVVSDIEARTLALEEREALLEERLAKLEEEVWTNQ